MANGGNSHDIATCLTANRIKEQTYGTDLDFKRAFAIVSGRWTGDARLRDRLWNISALLIRPDAILSNRLHRVVSALPLHGLKPVAVRPVWLTAQQASTMWKYQNNVSTPERLELIGTLMTMCPSIYVGLRDQTTRRSAPSTVHLTYLKGPTLAARRRPAHLRRLAGPPIANLLSYLHVADDPADVVRELSVLFPNTVVASILEEVDAAEDRTEALLQLFNALGRNLPRGLLPSASSTAGAQTTPDVRRWLALIERAKSIRSFIDGESYNLSDVIVPDDKRLSLPLDGHLVFSDLGSRGC